MAGLGGTTKEWIQFFTEAGIPSGVAATYALTFSSNRIRMDMLLDLNKEYLKDMGITLMGDVISILRHAKHVHEQNAREKILASSSSPTLVTSTPSKSTPASRMLDHYMRKTEERDETSSQHGTQFEKKTAEVTSIPIVRTKKQIIKTKPESDIVAPPPKKVRRVLPEHEGSYKITMPSGSTPRSQKILAKQGLLTQKKKTVFDRLGDGNVTSTTENDGPSITITGLGTNIVKPAVISPDKQSSVFSRLGEKPLVSSTSSQDTEDEKKFKEVTPLSRETVLPYAGVFKQEPRKKIMKKVDIKKVKVPTMQADIESAQKLITEDGRVVSKAIQVQERLGSSLPENVGILKPPSLKVTQKIIKTNKTTAGILANPTNAKKLSVKARLGSSDSDSSMVIDTSSANRKKKIIWIKRSSQNDDSFSRHSSKVRSNVTPVKSVTFGGVTKKTFIPREAIISTKSKNVISLSKTVNSNFRVSKVQKTPIRLKTGVFSRLGS